MKKKKTKEKREEKRERKEQEQQHTMNIVCAIKPKGAFNDNGNDDYEQDERKNNELHRFPDHTHHYSSTVKTGCCFFFIHLPSIFI
jgi:hypothetical protein